MPFQLINNYNSSSNLKIGKRQFYYGWMALIACVLILTTAYGIRYSFGVFFKSLEQEFSWTRALTSGIFSAYMLLCCLFAPLGGWAADRYGARKVVIVLGIFSCLGLSLTSQANALWHLFLSYSLLLAVGTGPVYAIVMATATRWFAKRRGLAIAIVGIGVGLSTILVAPISAYLIAGYGWRTSYLILALIAIFVMIPCALLLKRTRGEAAALAKDEKPKTINLNPPKRQNSNEPKEFTLLQATKTRSFWLLFSTWFCYAVPVFIVMTHAVRHAIDLGIASMQAASILSIMGFANIPGRILMGIATDRFGWKRIAVICALLMAAAMLWLAESTSLWMLYLFAVVFGAAFGGLAPPVTVIVGGVFGVRHVGAIIGILEIGWAAGATVAPVLAGLIFDTTGSYYLAFLLGMIASLLMVVSLLIIRTSTAKTGK